MNLSHPSTKCVSVKGCQVAANFWSSITARGQQRWFAIACGLLRGLPSKHSPTCALGHTVLMWEMHVSGTLMHVSGTLIVKLLEAKYYNHHPTQSTAFGRLNMCNHFLQVAMTRNKLAKQQRMGLIHPAFPIQSQSFPLHIAGPSQRGFCTGRSVTAFSHWLKKITSSFLARTSKVWLSMRNLTACR